jgi:hypothetical protein
VRYFAHLRKGSTRVRHYIGLPPELTRAEAGRTLLPQASVLVLEPDPDAGGAMMLFRYTGEGEFAGDTWHECIEDAKHQAAFEYGDSVGEWIEIPAGVEEALGYALAQACP